MAHEKISEHEWDKLVQALEQEFSGFQIQHEDECIVLTSQNSGRTVQFLLSNPPKGDIQLSVHLAGDPEKADEHSQQVFGFFPGDFFVSYYENGDLTGSKKAHITQNQENIRHFLSGRNPSLTGYAFVSAGF